MPKVACKIKGEDDNDAPLHSAINEEEAKCYSKSLNGIIIEMGTNIWDEVPNAIKVALQRYKETIATMVPGMGAVDPDIVWKAIKDKVSLSICPMTKEKEQLLENLIPNEDIPSAAQVLNTLENPDDIIDEHRALIAKVFESLEVAHSDLASTCSALSRLSQRLKP